MPSEFGDPMLSSCPHPLALSDITAAWMTAALDCNHPGTVVGALRALHVIHGTATKVRYQLEYGRNPHSLPATLWLKGGFESHSAATSAGNRNEAQFFRDLAGDFDANLPVSYYQSICATSGEGLVLLEDLLVRSPPTSFCNLTRPLTAKDTAAVLDMQARYHARLWNSPRLDELTWLAKGGFITENGLVDYFFSLWQTSERLPRFAKVAAPLRTRQDDLKRGMNTMLQFNRDQARCVVHGDTHMGNLFFNGERPGYLDWQTVMRGSWGFDVAPLMISALPVESRRAHERELLAHYLACLARYGVSAPSLDEAWLTYRRFAIWSFMFALCPPEFQCEENCTAVAERASAALIDLETLAALSTN